MTDKTLLNFLWQLEHAEDEVPEEEDDRSSHPWDEDEEKKVKDE